MAVTGRDGQGLDWFIALQRQGPALTGPEHSG
jgi:hypothetical protein